MKVGQDFQFKMIMIGDVSFSDNGMYQEAPRARLKSRAAEDSGARML
jgi:hypothetical protein